MSYNTLASGHNRVLSLKCQPRTTFAYGVKILLVRMGGLSLS